MRYELKIMYMTRLSYIDCPVCKKKIEHRFVKTPNKAKLALINKEIQCPKCESILIMDKKSQNRLKNFFIIALVYLPFSVIMLADQLMLLNIFSNVQKLIGTVPIVAILFYLFYTATNVKYVSQQELGS